MRRGKLNKVSILFIVIAAIFAIASFSLDQMVIQTEDQLRKKNSEYQKAMFDFQQYGKINISYVHTYNVITDNTLFLSFSNEFYKEVLGSFVLDPDYYEKHFYLDALGKEENEKHKYNLIQTYKIEYLNLYSEYLAYMKYFPKILDSMSFNDPVLTSIHSKAKKKYSIDFNYHYDFLDSIEKQSNYLSDVESINNIYFKLRSLNTILGEAYQLTDQVKEVTTKKFNKNYHLAEKISDNMLRLKKYKNNFILYSVLSQIAGLLFLLLLFRNIILQLK